MPTTPPNAFRPPAMLALVAGGLTTLGLLGAIYASFSGLAPSVPASAGAFMIAWLAASAAISFFVTPRHFTVGFLAWGLCRGARPREKKPDDWNAAVYARHSSLQQAMAEEVLSLLALSGDERVLDLGCGDGRLSARIADRLPGGTVLGVDASIDMVAFAVAHFARDGVEPRANLRFEVADAHALAYRAEFDLLVSFNALHWVPEQAAALRGIAAALRREGRAMLRMVSKGPITSLEEVAEATRALARWAPHFSGFADPYLRVTPTQYAALAEHQGLRVLSQHTHAREWDFATHEAFFGFYQMDITLARMAIDR